MPSPRKLTSIQVLERLQLRLEKRMESLQRVKLPGFSRSSSPIWRSNWTIFVGRRATWMSDTAPRQSGQCRPWSAKPSAPRCSPLARRGQSSPPFGDSSVSCCSRGEKRSQRRNSRPSKQNPRKDSRRLRLTCGSGRTWCKPESTVPCSSPALNLRLHDLWPTSTYEPQNEPEDSKKARLFRRLQGLMEAHDATRTAIEAKRPFFAEDLYDSVTECLDTAQIEAHDIRRTDPNNFYDTWFREVTSIRAKFSKGYSRAANIIRDRISKLAILPRS
jgi:hypothetical protein